MILLLLQLRDEKGNCAVIYPINGIWSERLARALTVEMGGKMTNM